MRNIYDNRVYEKTLLYLLVMLTILMSGAVFFSIDDTNSIVFWITYAVTIFLGLIRFGKQDESIDAGSVLIPSALLVLLAISVLGNWDNWSIDGLHTALTFAGKIAGVAVLAFYINRDDFRIAYVDCVVVICVVSGVFYVVGQLDTELGLRLVTNIQDKFSYNPFYMFGWDGGVSSRNAGPFWEPGAFAGPLIIAVLIAIRNANLIRGLRLKLVILIVSAITTHSTTGYILLLLVLVSSMSDIHDIFLSRQLKKHAMIVPVFVLVLLALAFIPDIYEKLVTPNTSGTIRRNDFSGGIYMLSGSGLFGYGYGASLMEARAATGVDAGNSVGLFSLITIYGIPFGLVYFALMLSGMIRMVNAISMKEQVVAGVVLIVLQSTEVIYYMPLYIIMLFDMPNVTSFLSRRNSSNRGKQALSHFNEMLLSD